MDESTDFGTEILRLPFPSMATKQTTKNPQAVEIGKRIKTRRLELGMSRRELAVLLKTREGKPQSTGKIAQWEQGVSVPAPDRRPELAEALNTDIGTLFGEAQDIQTLSRLDLVERKIDAVITIQGLGDLVEAKLQEFRRRDRLQAEEHRKAMMRVAEQAPKLARKSARPSRRRRKGS